MQAIWALEKIDAQFEPQLEMLSLAKTVKGPTKIAEKKLKDGMVHLLCGQVLELADW